MATSSAAGAGASGPGQLTKEQVLARYQDLRATEQNLLQRLAEMQAQESEHRCVGYARHGCVYMPTPRRSRHRVLHALSAFPRCLRARRLVAETLRPMEPDRRCHHLVSGVLVERTVKEVLPIIEHNRDAVRMSGRARGAFGGRRMGPP